ncbi:hypothetical protein D9M72_444000 [compost metagenome]
MAHRRPRRRGRRRRRRRRSRGERGRGALDRRRHIVQRHHEDIAALVGAIGGVAGELEDHAGAVADLQHVGGLDQLAAVVILRAPFGDAGIGKIDREPCRVLRGEIDRLLRQRPFEFDREHGLLADRADVHRLDPVALRQCCRSGNQQQQRQRRARGARERTIPARGGHADTSSLRLVIFSFHSDTPSRTNSRNTIS